MDKATLAEARVYAIDGGLKVRGERTLHPRENDYVLYCYDEIRRQALFFSSLEQLKRDFAENTDIIRRKKKR